jgi:hypothetical protein
MVRAAGIAAVERLEFDRLEPLRKQVRLAQTNVGQRAVGVPLHAALAVPHGLAMTYQYELGHI